MSDPIAIDLAEIIGPMTLQRDQLLVEADQAAAWAAHAREQARAAAESVLAEGEQTALQHEQTAKTKRAYAERWSGVIAREQAAGIGVPVTR